MLTVVIIVLVVLMLVGPVMMLRPSPLQKKQALLRGKAAEKGLMVRSGQKRTDGRFSISYTLPNPKADNEREPWCLMRQNFTHEGHFFEDWDWNTEPAIFKNESQLKQLLSSKAQDFNSVRVDRLGVTVDWNEKLNGESEDAAVEKVKQFLIQLEALKQ